MAKFYGRVGFARQLLDDETQITHEVLQERPYKGDVLSASVAWQQDQEIHDDLQLSNRISIVTDKFANEHYGEIRYVVIGEVRWKVTRVEFKPPRLILSVGGVYNGE